MFTLKIKTDNAAFHESAGPAFEVAQLLQEIAKRVARGLDDSGKVYDANGNHVGEWKLR